MIILKVNCLPCLKSQVSERSYMLMPNPLSFTEMKYRAIDVESEGWRHSDINLPTSKTELKSTSFHPRYEIVLKTNTFQYFPFALVSFLLIGVHSQIS